MQIVPSFDMLGNSIDINKVLNSDDYRRFALQTAELQHVEISFLETKEKAVFWLNTYHTLLLHGLLKFGAPKSIFMR